MSWMDRPGALNFIPARLDRQPAEGELSPGLQVTYYNNIFNFVAEVREWAELVAGEPGTPLLSLGLQCRLRQRVEQRSKRRCRRHHQGVDQLSRRRGLFHGYAIE